MHKGQLATLPAAEGRRAERRVVNLAASLREPGATVVDAEVLNLSTDGFMAVSEARLEPHQTAFLKLPGLETRKAEVMWTDGDKAGFRFTSPLHPGELDQMVLSSRKTPPRGHFGPRSGW